MNDPTYDINEILALFVFGFALGIILFMPVDKGE